MLRYLCSLAAGLGLCMGAHAAVVTSAYTALGGDAWSVRLGVQNDGTPGVITGFTVYFDAASYQGLSLRQGLAGWNTLVLPGDLALPSIGNSNALFKPDRPWVNPIPGIGNSNALFKPDRPWVNPIPPHGPGLAHPSTA